MSPRRDRTGALAGDVILSTLDCGCALMGDGSRVWCPTCASIPPAAPLAEDAAQHLRNAQALAWVWRDMLNEQFGLRPEAFNSVGARSITERQLLALRDVFQAISDRLDAAAAAL